MGNQASFEKIGECLYRNSSSQKYYALVKVRGKQIRSSLKTTNLAEARRKLKDFRRDIGRVDPNAGKITVEALADRYLATVEHQALGTVEKKRAIVERIKKQWGPRQAKSLQKSAVLAWLAAFDFGASSRNKHLRAIRAMFKLAVDDRILLESPVAGVKEEKVAKPIRLTPTLEEFDSIVASIREQELSDTGEESADVVEAYGLGGLGLAEVASMTWADVNFKREQIRAFRHKTKAGFAIPLFPQLRPLLEKRYAMAKAANKGKAPAPSTRVFSVLNPKKAIEAACDRLCLSAYTSRAFRRLFITTAIERGVDIKVIAQWQGHRDGGKLLLDTYSHVRPVHSQQMAKLMTLDKPANVIQMQGVA